MDNKTKTEIRAIIADAVAEKISQSDATEQIIGLSSPPLQGIEELRDKFKKQFHFSFSATYDKVFNWFLPHLSNDAEVKELRAEIEKLEKLTTRAQDIAEQQHIEIADLKLKLEQQGVSDRTEYQNNLIRDYSRKKSFNDKEKAEHQKNKYKDID